MALKHPFHRAFSLFMAFLTIIPKSEKPLRPNQKLATSEDFNCSCNLSAISAINSEFIALIADKLQLQLKSSEVANF